MNKSFIEETGTRAVELATSLGRIHAENLTTMADATAKTPLGPLFSINAKLAVMTTEGLESVFAPFAASKPTPKKAAKPAPVKAKAAAKPAKAKPAVVESIEPEAEDVIADAAVESAPETAAKPAVKTEAISETVSIHDDLGAISGVGPSTMRKLKTAGVNTYTDIAGMSVEKFESLLEKYDIRMMRYSAADWIEQAKQLSKIAA